MSEHLLVLAPEALKNLARHWFLQGFRLSGVGFNGEAVFAGSEAVVSLLSAEFDRLYGERHGQ